MILQCITLSTLARKNAGVHSTHYSQSSPRDVIKALMAEQGIPSGRQLALLAEVDQPSLSRYLSGKTKDMEVGTIRKLAGFFNVSLAELLGEAPLASKVAREAQQMIYSMDEPTLARWIRLGRALADEPGPTPPAGPASR